VVDRNGQLLDILRVETPDYPERAAMVRVSADGSRTTFNPATGFIEFPGGAKKFTIRHDSKSDLYWTLATIVPEQIQLQEKDRRPARVRNTLALLSSKELTTWTTRCLLLHHPEVNQHGFQYVDWLFEGDDIIAACRTAFDDAEGGAHNNHDANYLTFHRFKNFRTLSEADSVSVERKPH
jgi:hypothetical protein